ncbi:MAG: ribose-phosphate diphosphokinase [Myxococcales bacterium]|nr:ribose-phosphate diphosphokinase [Myxococcales bacterium]
MSPSAPSGLNPAPLVFCTAAYEPLCRELCALTQWDAGEVDRRVFPDGERYQRLLTSPADRECILLGGTVDDAGTLELYDLACALSHYGAARLSLVIPYFGHATMERASQSGEVVTAKNRARLLSSIPAAARGLQVFLLDLHTEGITHYFEGGIRPVHIYAKPVILAAARELAGDGVASLVFACTDAGRAKWVESLANDLGVPAAFVYKRRTSGDATEVTGVSASVSGKHVIIYDDMIRTGGSLLGAARAYQHAGAARIDAITTHGVFPGEAFERLTGSGLFGTIIATNSHPSAQGLAARGLAVRSIAPVLAAHLLENR